LTKKGKKKEQIDKLTEKEKQIDKEPIPSQINIEADIDTL
jgi:hypothetical protein